MRWRLLSETMTWPGSSTRADRGRALAFPASKRASPSTTPRVSGSTCRAHSITCRHASARRSGGSAWRGGGHAGLSAHLLLSVDGNRTVHRSGVLPL